MRGLLHSNKPLPPPLSATLEALVDDADDAEAERDENPALRDEAAHLTGVLAEGVTEGEGVVAREDAEMAPEEESPMAPPMRSLEANLR